MTASVVIQGGPASFSAMAAGTLFGPEVELLHKDSFAAAMDTFHRTRGVHLLLPWWNRIIGPIDPVQTIVREAVLSHVDEITLPVHLCLIGQGSEKLVGDVYSHPAALEQCCHFFRDYPALRPRIGTDTADSLRLIHDGLARFAIASRRAARQYNLTILAEGIQNRADNVTAFRLYRNH